MGTSSNRGAKPGKAAHAITLPADCRMAGLMALKDQLMSSLEKPTVEISAGVVDRVDTAGMQLLLAFQREAHDRHCKVAWSDVSAVLRDAAQRLGLTTLLGLPAVMPA